MSTAGEAPQAVAVAPSTGTDVATQTRRKIALRLLPFLFILYAVNYLDRTSVAYATLQMSKNLGFTDKVFGLAAGIFFLGYVALQIPGALVVEKWSARRCISVLMVVWGSLTVLTALVHTPGQLYAARFVLGAAEAGFFPGVIVYLSHWFIRADRAKATSNFMIAIPISFIAGSPLAGWTLGQHWLGLEGWRWLFVVEGLPAVLLGVVAYFYLTDRPHEAKWLGAEQKQWIEQQLDEERRTTGQKVKTSEAFRSRAVLLLAGVVFLEYIVFYSFVFWWPTILKRLSGYSDVRVGFLGAVPYVAALIAMQVNGWHSDKTGERRWHVSIPLFAAALGLLGLLVLPGSTPTAIALFTMMGVMQGFLPPLWPMPSEIMGGAAAAAAVGIINGLASIAGFAGPYVFGYLYSRTGSFSSGLVVMLISATAGGLLILGAPKAKRIA